MVHLHNSATGRIEELKPTRNGIVSMYVCGPTVYDVPHIGHGRFVLVFDILRRYLEYLGLTVRHVSNITDIDDKILARAMEEGSTPAVIAAKYEQIWWETLDSLKVKRPNYVPHATGYIDAMIDLIQTLVEREFAYVGNDGVYFDVSKVPDYGLLAHQTLESMRIGARIEPNPNKKSALDFALWKIINDGSWTWESPFGAGRPGWHTECVVMAEDLLGDNFDIHGGGADLSFPHHENERAQASSLGHKFASIWVHNGFIITNGEKMSKSLANYVTLPELIGTNDARSYRLLVLQAHYRSPLEVNIDLIGDAARSLERIDTAIFRYQGIATKLLDPVRPSIEVLTAFKALMDNDLDTSGSVALLFGAITRMNAKFDADQDRQGCEIGAAIVEIAETLGLATVETPIDIPVDVQLIFEARENARFQKNFDESDQLRNQLLQRGWIVVDSKTGGILRPVPQQ